LSVAEARRRMETPTAEEVGDARSQSSRDGEAGLRPAEPERGKAWKPSQGFHINDVSDSDENAEEKREAAAEEHAAQPSRRSPHGRL
jgi:hypothetical protein